MEYFIQNFTFKLERDTTPASEAVSPKKWENKSQILIVINEV